MHLDQFDLYPNPFRRGLGEPSIGNVQCILTKLVSTLCLPPTPSEEGWGRQNVKTDLVNIWTGVHRDSIRIRPL